MFLSSPGTGNTFTKGKQFLKKETGKSKNISLEVAMK
jgi:hypothetical protein